MDNMGTQQGGGHQVNVNMPRPPMTGISKNMIQPEMVVEKSNKNPGGTTGGGGK